MSDDASTPIDLRPRKPLGLFEHYCEHPGCRQWGGWGFPRGRQTIWLCYEHRHEGEL